MRSRKRLCIFVLVVAGNANCPHADGVPMSLAAECYQDAIPALGIYREARNQRDAAMRGVAWVIRTRAADPLRWPNTPAEVVTQPKQFSAFNAGDPNSTKWPKADSMAWLRSCAAWESHEPDPTGGANHYHSGTNYAAIAKAWGLTVEELHAAETAKLGAFTFYRL